MCLYGTLDCLLRCIFWLHMRGGPIPIFMPGLFVAMSCRADTCVGYTISLCACEPYSVTSLLTYASLVNKGAVDAKQMVRTSVFSIVRSTCHIHASTGRRIAHACDHRRNRNLCHNHPKDPARNLKQRIMQHQSIGLSQSLNRFQRYCNAPVCLRVFTRVSC